MSRRRASKKSDAKSEQTKPKPRRFRAAPAIPLNPILQTVIDPRIFKRIEALAKVAITMANHQSVREAVGSLSLELRTIAYRTYGHESVDSIVLHELLKKTDPNKKEERKKPREESFDELSTKGLLNAVQVSAGGVIKSVWEAFGRGLSIQLSSYERGGKAKRSRMMGPVDVMGEELWEIWRDVYTPWYENAKRRTINRRTTGRVHVVDIVFKVLVQRYYVEDLDKFLDLEPGTTLKALQNELTRFFDPTNDPEKESNDPDPEKPKVAA